MTLTLARELTKIPNTDNPYSVRLYESLIKYTDENTASKIANKIPISKSASINKKFEWAESICADLRNAFDDDLILKIRMDCACGPAIGKINALTKLYQDSDNLDDFIVKANELHQGFTIANKDNSLFLVYPQCYCSCVKRIDKPISEIWCYCTLGYTKKMFAHVLGRNVNVELLESVKTGGSKCVIKITE